MAGSDVRYPFPGTWYLLPQATKPPFDNLKVRRAVAHAIDRENVVKVSQGLAVPAWSMIPPGFPGFFDDKKIMETPGIPLTRWFDAVTLPKDQVDQKDNIRAMFVQGHASNSITRIPESMKGLQKVDLLVVADPHPPARLHGRRRCC